MTANATIRTCATALALVNWKGVFYERYLLDRHVTALEGENGAGKTTVMIAAYVVLLPDLSRLRFTNLGETAATGGDRGIWGRLGEPGRPSYAVMELALPSGERLIAGVHLERKTEPSLELTPFIVSGLDVQGSLKDLLLRSSPEHDEIPLLSEVREAVEGRGGSMQICASAKEYFGALFEKGVLPLRLSTEEERTKMHDMLRTSMTGGISRALTSELRAFLLKEESGLADTVVRMRTNLEACRRTRIEIAEARALERELTGIFDVGRSMFRAATAAIRGEAVRTSGALAAAKSNVAKWEAEHRALASEVLQKEERGTAIEARLVSLEGLLADVTTRRARCLTGRDLRRRIDELQAAHEQACRVSEDAGGLRSLAEGARTAAKAARDRAREAYERAARGLGDLQAGLDELHLRAHARKLAWARIEEARELLDRPSLAPSELQETASRVRIELAAVETEHARAEREAALRAVHLADFVRADAALSRMTKVFADAKVEVPGATRGEHVDGHAKYTAARALLSKFVELRALEGRADEIDEELERAEAFETHGRDVRARAEELGLGTGVELSSERVERAATEAEERGRTLDRELLSVRHEIDDATKKAVDFDAEAERLEETREAWRELEMRIERLEAHAGKPARTTSEVALVRSLLTDERERTKAEWTEHSERRREHLALAERLETAAGLPETLLTLRDRLAADLLASRFDGSSIDDARWIEAALGPLAHALVVPDPAVAAEALAHVTDAPETVWLIAEGDVDRVLERIAQHERGEGHVDVVVRDELALRVSRIQDVPVLGRAARNERIRRLRQDADEATRRQTELEARAAKLDARIDDADRLLAEAARLEAGDPAVRAHERRERAREERERADAKKSHAETTARSLEETRRRFDALRSLLPHAHRLDMPSPSLRARIEKLTVEATYARRATHVVAAAQSDYEALVTLIDALRNAHLHADETPESATRREEALRTMATRRDRLARAKSALDELLLRPEALDFADAEEALDKKRAVGSALEAQHAEARKAAEDAENALQEAEANWERATAAWQSAEAEREATQAHRRRVEAERRDGGFEGWLDEDVDALERTQADLTAEREALERENRDRVAAQAIATERLRQAEAAFQDAVVEREHAALEAAPAEAAWTAFEANAQTLGILSDAIDAADTTSPTEARAQARADRALLVDRLSKAQGGSDGEHAVVTAFETLDESQAYLEAWLATRRWALRRLPTTFEAHRDPAEALDKLRGDLAELETRIGIHESQLRGTSEDVARGIDVHLRKTSARVRRLNHDLAATGFGSVAAIRVQVRRVERMDLVLSALRGGEVQELLFQSNLPFEEALSEVFKRYGGGNRSGASRLLDYREYIELVVEIRRRGSAETEWEVASPTRLSTGEAIGVGAALMMVILTEWERDANLLRSDRNGRKTGTLRFLFLDEANRLSPDNLAVLFDLCGALDLQLLIAAPEVARAHGNTTYRLVRRVDDVGREEVIVSGRKAVDATPTQGASPGENRENAVLSSCRGAVT